MLKVSVPVYNCVSVVAFVSVSVSFSVAVSVSAAVSVDVSLTVPDSISVAPVLKQSPGRQERREERQTTRRAVFLPPPARWPGVVEVQSSTNELQAPLRAPWHVVSRTAARSLGPSPVICGTAHHHRLAVAGSRHGGSCWCEQLLCRPATIRISGAGAIYAANFSAAAGICWPSRPLSLRAYV